MVSVTWKMGFREASLLTEALENEIKRRIEDYQRVDHGQRTKHQAKTAELRTLLNKVKA
jgi:hypothetical protein